MSAIKEVFKPKASSKKSGGKTPAYYNEEKNRCIADMATHSNAIVRNAIALNPHTPTKVLVGMLEIEQDKQILRAVIMNERMPRKAVAKFVNDVNDTRVEWFADDEEMIEHFKQ